jgi:hypothetical protein
MRGTGWLSSLERYHVGAEGGTVTLEQLRQRRAEVLRVITRHGGRTDVLVFGSTARGESGAASDLDLIIEMEAGRSLLDRVKMAMELEEMLGLPVETVSPAALHPLMRASVMREAQHL